jgi:hypothetical protein
MAHKNNLIFLASKGFYWFLLVSIGFGSWLCNGWLIFRFLHYEVLELVSVFKKSETACNWVKLREAG